MATYFWFKISSNNVLLQSFGSGNGLLSDGTKPLPEPLSRTIIKVQWQSFDDTFTRDTTAVNHQHYLELYYSEIPFKSSRDLRDKHSGFLHLLLQHMILVYPSESKWWNIYHCSIVAAITHFKQTLACVNQSCEKDKSMVWYKANKK